MGASHQLNGEETQVRPCTQPVQTGTPSADHPGSREGVRHAQSGSSGPSASPPHGPQPPEDRNKSLLLASLSFLFYQIPSRRLKGILPAAADSSPASVSFAACHNGSIAQAQRYQPLPPHYPERPCPRLPLRHQHTGHPPRLVTHRQRLRKCPSQPPVGVRSPCGR